MSEDEDALEKSARRYDIGRSISNVAVFVGMASVVLAGRDYFSSGDGDMVPVAGLVAMAAMYSSYHCERMSTWLRAGEDPWGEKYTFGDRIQAYKNFFSGKHKDLFDEDEDSDESI